ncbi:disease resistance protein LAZ5-like [Ziziphus jujuba]|uniref:ADP-ribosyl cyclase/cyclic ADP-ribose hydrolase n=1 Tax=Ziziphus jujuba TaxID=326968 RepID=A0A6P4AMI8_ZIZJJ|nr:disease resistance protein LAZ5-like [Ziziphus jujuba]
MENSYSSSSSFSSNSIKSTHDVYLSFRGEDTRNGFTSHLYSALIRKGILAFMDVKLQEMVGEDIASTLFKAVEESESYIVVLSENYASSIWCLDELVKIVECTKGWEKIIFPIFYHVDPSDVRKQRGCIEKAFAIYETRFRDDIQKVQRWREALKRLTDRSGWHIDHRSDEAKFIYLITAEIFKRITSLRKTEKATKRSEENVEEINSTSFDSSLCQSSSPSSNSIKPYDVFMSFSGEDTRNGFTSHLYYALSEEGILTYMDDVKQTEKGEGISSTLLEAIEESEYFIVILSENYASSVWCLTELVKIVECKQVSGRKVFPIYYHVEPTHIRKQRGIFEEAFERHEQRFIHDLEKVQSWRYALRRVIDIVGWLINPSRSFSITF